MEIMIYSLNISEVMLIETILSNGVVQSFIQLIIVLSVLRAFFILGIIFAAIAYQVILSRKPLSGDSLNNRISPYLAIEKIFYNFFGQKSKPFLVNKVY